MRTAIKKGKERTEGSVLVTALVICGLLGASLGGYLLMVKAQAATVARSQAWNSALAMAEAGAEEALAQVNPGTASSLDLSANGWGIPSGGFYGPKTRSISNDTYSVCYTAGTPPTIYSTGQVSVGVLSATLSRTIRVTTTNIPLFGVAIAALNNINMNGSGILTDSFDSSNPNLSNGGMYSSSVASTNGSVASLGGAVNVGNSTVKGDIYLGPGATDTIKASGTITGTEHYDFNADFPDVVLPFSTNTLLVLPALGSPTNIDGVAYVFYAASSGDFQLGAGAGNLYVAPGARVRLYVPISYSPAIVRIGGTGSSSGNLQIYMAGASFSLSGQAIVDGGVAANLAYWGLPSNTSITMSGNASFVGTIYAPEAVMSLGGGGTSLYDFCGSCIVKSMTMNGHFSFHFDEALAKTGPSRGYLATGWREL